MNLVLMKRLVVPSIVVVLLGAATVSASAQVEPSAYGRQLSITAGALASGFQPDYEGGLVAQASPYRLYGPGAFVDVKFTKWVQIEGEARWLRFNQFANINESNYLIGPRLPIQRLRFWRATPYAKVLIGLGKMNFEYNEASGSFTDIAYGGGLDIRVTKRISVRAIDFEFQEWPKWVNSSLYPYGASVGVGYKIF
jgi:opacity protein-like surface antigen